MMSDKLSGGLAVNRILDFTVTENALKKIHAIRATGGSPVALRLSVVGGGCAGFRYIFSLERVLNFDVKNGDVQMKNKENYEFSVDDRLDDDQEDDFDDEDLDDEDLEDEDFDDEDFDDEDFDDEDFDDEDFDDEDFDDDDFDDDDFDDEDGDLKLRDASGNVLFIADHISCSFLKGATIDYVEGLGSSEFRVINTSKKGVCGCGSSFIS